MNALPSTAVETVQPALSETVQAVCERIAPTWPLDRMIAVSPYWHMTNQPFREVAAELARLAGSPLTMPLDYYRQQWQAGRIRPADLAQAIAESDSALTVAALQATLNASPAAPAPAPLFTDTLDSQRDLQHEPAWCDTITLQIGQFCAAYFDQDQADWHPDRQASLYASWRSALGRDHSVALLMKAPWIPARAKQLAADPLAQIEQALTQLAVPAEEWEALLQTVLMRVSGWAAWCAYRRWQARLAGADDSSMIDLLAIRLSWEVLLDAGDRQQGSVWQRWQQRWLHHHQHCAQTLPDSLLLWQRAEEISYQRSLALELGTVATTATPAPSVQAVFCIDVRSEVFRRHFEAQSTAIQTLGYAGFFGLPISYQPLGTHASRPQLPGLLAPALQITDSSGDPEQDRQLAASRRSALGRLRDWQPFQTLPASAFTLVESLGLGYAGNLIRRSLPDRSTGQTSQPGLSRQQSDRLCPQLPSGDCKARAELAGKILRGMNLNRDFARLVLLLGHGSQTRNNPQRAGLDCGACCGQTGEVNARALASLLNDPAVREALPDFGITVPADTVFVAGLHNTTTDDVQLFDLARLPASHQTDLAELQCQLAAAGAAARQERAPALGLAERAKDPEKLHQLLRERANDWSETRPEWGLANNAAFLIAPRQRSRGANLAGRSFLHEYDPQQDTDGSLLEQIMTAPMLVTHWINMQYFASTVDNRRYGSGNKTLHNVIGGRLGVFEGNGGDLRIGLAWQSVHDGEQFRHQPLRLTVVIDAPPERILAIVDKHHKLRELVDNEWLYLARFGASGLVFYRNGQWC